MRYFNSAVFASLAFVSCSSRARAGSRHGPRNPAAAADRSKPKPLTGEMHLQYYFAEAGEGQPYRLYVPTTYDGKTACPDRHLSRRRPE